MIFRHEVDPTIINGFRVNVANQEHDLTWNRQIDQANEEFRQENNRILATKASVTPQFIDIDVREALKSLTPGLWPAEMFTRFVEM